MIYGDCQAICCSNGVGVLNKALWKPKGQYICTLDNYHGDSDQVDTATSEMPDEHKSFNLIQLRNGQFALYPNNRCRIYDTSMTPQNVKMPDFKVSTRIFEVENDVNWGRLGDCDDYFWTTPDERREE